MTTPIPIWIDTDPGVDDALAILLALRSPEVQVVGISTTHGNVGIRQATENACRVLELSGVVAPPPVYRGAARPLVRKATHSPSVHGRDGLGEVSALTTRKGDLRYPKPRLRARREDAATALCRALRAARRNLTVVTLGPLTNLAAVLRTDRRAGRNIKRVFVMGGAVDCPGNETPAAEFNFYCDPEAAREVVNAGLPLTLVGLGVTRRARVSRKQLEAATTTRTPVNRFLRDATLRIMRYYRQREGFYGCCLHDPLTVASVILPKLITTRRLHVDVETAGHATAGMTVADVRPIARGRVGRPNVDVAVNMDPAGFRRLLLRRICDA